MWLRELVVQYSVYRGRLDRMFRAKRLNNYMLLPDSGRCSQQQASTYYKLRLYRYCHRYCLASYPTSAGIQGINISSSKKLL